tara:strand:- start:1534 stop:1776 length:243 start_codon:yes stop_codon:yes gene_type:complete
VFDVIINDIIIYKYINLLNLKYLIYKYINMPATTRSKFIKPVLNDNSPNVKFQYDIKGSIEKSKKVRYKDVFDIKKVKKK